MHRLLRFAVAPLVLALACGGNVPASGTRPDASNPLRDATSGGGHDAKPAPDASKPERDATSEGGRDAKPVPDASKPEHDAASEGGHDAKRVPDASGGTCPPYPDGGVSPGIPVNGSITGPDVQATICNMEVAFAQNLLQITTVDATSVVFETPAGGNYAAEMVVDIPVTAGPGVYTSSADAAVADCSRVEFAFTLPVPAGVDCGTGVGPTCPAGCSSECDLGECTPCTPDLTYIFYNAQPSCPAHGEPALGSYTLTVTSIEPVPGSTYYSYVHGNLTATVFRDFADAGTESATLTLTF